MNKSSFFSFDIILLLAVITLIVFGILFIYSSGVSSSGKVVSREFQKQIVWAVSGIILMVFFLFSNYSRFKDLSLIIYGVSIVLLLFTLIFGREVNGAQSWIYIGSLGFQPSEFTKLTTIFFLGFYLERTGKKIRSLPYFLLGLGIVLLPMGIIMLQPDMGTALVFFPIYICMAFMAGAKVRHISFILLTGALVFVFTIAPEYERLIMGSQFPVLGVLRNGAFILITSGGLLTAIGLSVWGWIISKHPVYYWFIYFFSIIILALFIAFEAGSFLKDYQFMRLISFLNPYLDAKNTGWNIIQSITAVGSGGFSGKGFLMGTQSHFQYLPQQSTDFIFSILAEEWGFVGGGLVLILFFIILYRGVKIISNTNDRYATLIGSGILGMIYFHIIINIGMTMGLMPITGIPLIFLSYGGTALWNALMAVGILLNISYRRFRYT